MKIMLIILSLSLFLAGTSMAADSGPLSKDDAYVIVDNLVGLTDEPKDINASLAKYKQWEKLHLKIRQNALANIKQMSLYLLVVFIADSRAMADTQEEISREIVDIYQKDKTLFLSALNNNPAFIPVVCSNLRNHFNMFGKDQDLNKFIAKNQSLIEKQLYDPFAKSCLASLKNDDHNNLPKREAAKSRRAL